MMLPLASVAFDCAVLLGLLEIVNHNTKALDVCGRCCRKIAAALGKLCVTMNCKAKLVVDIPSAAARVACPETGRAVRGQKSQWQKPINNHMHLIHKIKSLHCRELLTISSKINAKYRLPSCYLQQRHFIPHWSV